MLSQLIYSSDVVDLGSAGIDGLVNEARAKNEVRLLTGVLVFNKNHFLQCLEGSREAVTQAFCRIVADKRHDHVTLMSVGDIHQRAFPDWSMGHVSLNLNVAVLRRFQPTGDFAPRSLSADAALSLLTLLRAIDCAV